MVTESDKQVSREGVRQYAGTGGVRQRGVRHYVGTKGVRQYAGT